MSEDMKWMKLIGEGELDFRDADQIAELFDKATELTAAHKGLKGSCVHLPPKGSVSAEGSRVVMTGDIHDHALNLTRVVKYADLDHRVNDYLILHEVVHGENTIGGMDLSVRMLARVAWLKVKYGDRVIVLQSNHELAQRNGERIMKSGGDQVEEFDRGLDYLFNDGAQKVQEAVGRYIAGLPLAVKLANGVMCSHSLPGPRRMKDFDLGLLDRKCTDADLEPKQNVHLMVWGRKHKQEQLEELGKVWEVNQFVMGHQAVDMGYEEEGEMGLILASNHDHGVLLPIEMDRLYDQQQLVEGIVRLASVLLN